MSQSVSQQRDAVLEFLCDRRFHKQFRYSYNGQSLRVTYSDYGDPNSTSVVLFFGGLMGTRYSYSPLDQLAKNNSIRIIHADRPGVGGSDSVAIEDRIPAYIAMIPQLLEHLEVQHISLASHSFGTIYLINTLILYPHLLHPERPYVAFFAPWVHPKHTGLVHLQAAEMLPAGVIGQFSSLAKFVNGNILPLVGMSSGIGSAIASGIKGSLPQSVAPRVQTLAPQHPGDQRGESSDLAGVDLNDGKVVKELQSLIPTFLFAENVDGAGQDTQLCLRKPRSIPWCTASQHWEDVDDAVHQIRTAINTGNSRCRTTRTLRTDTFHAETDSMVGEKGQVWFDGCWKGGEGTSSQHEPSISYKRQRVAGSDHDFLLDPVFGASGTWLSHVAEAFKGKQC